MRSYTVHEKPSPAPDRLDRAEELVFIKDGFNFIAFILAPLWMVMNRLWLVLFGYLVVYAIIELFISALGLPPSVRAPLILGLGLLVGFEADSLHRWTLEQRGWHLVGTVTGENEAVCQRRFFEAWTPKTPKLDGDYLGQGLRGKAAADPFHETTTLASESNLGPVREPSRGRGLFGGWRSRTSS